MNTDSKLVIDISKLKIELFIAESSRGRFENAKYIDWVINFARSIACVQDEPLNLLRSTQEVRVNPSEALDGVIHQRGDSQVTVKTKMGLVTQLHRVRVPPSPLVPPFPSLHFAPEGGYPQGERERKKTPRVGVISHSEPFSGRAFANQDETLAELLLCTVQYL